jgi:hypothetical protein
MREGRWRVEGMRPIDGDRLKALLNDTEKTLKGIKKDNQLEYTHQHGSSGGGCGHGGS